MGRLSELARLKFWARDAFTGQGQIVVLVGEAGIGKTRTVQELASYARRRRALLLEGRSYDREGTPPYWPWVEVIRGAIHGVAGSRLRPLMGPGAADIAQVVPEVHERLQGLAKPAAIQSRLARFRLFESIGLFLNTLAKKQPLLLVLEDLHWADKPTLLLLEAVAGALAGSPVLIVITCRDVQLVREHPLSHTLGQLGRQRNFHRILLQGLSPDDVAEFIRAATGVSPSPGVRDMVFARTEGNPFFLNEVVRLFTEQRLSAAPRQDGAKLGSGVALPTSVRQAVRLQLERVSPRCGQVLCGAAASGREFALGDLRVMAPEVSAHDILECLHEARTLHLIDAVPGSRERYRFVHTLVQETIAEDLADAERARLHLLIGENLEKRYGEGGGEVAARLARHFFEAAPLIGTEKAVRYAIAAGNQALATYGYEEAITHFQRALDCKRGQPTDDETADVLFDLAHAQVAAQGPAAAPEAWEHWKRAFNHFLASKNVAHAVQKASLPVLVAVDLRAAEEAIEMLRQARSLVPKGSLAEGLLLDCFGHVFSVARGDYAESRAAYLRAIKIARRFKHATLERHAMANFAGIAVLHIRFAESLEICKQALARARDAGDRVLEVKILMTQLTAAYGIGQPEEARHLVPVLQRLAEEIRDYEALVAALIAQQYTAKCEGRWRAALEWGQRTLARAPAEPNSLGLQALIACEQGDLDRGRELAARLAAIMRGNRSGDVWAQGVGAIVLPLVARITNDDALLDKGAEAARYSVSFGLAAYGDYCATMGLALAAVLRGDGMTALAEYDKLAKAQGAELSIMFPDPGVSTQRVLGLLAATAGQRDQAAAHFKQAMAFCRKAGYRPELAWTLTDYAEMLVKRDAPGDAGQAAGLFREAQAIAQDVGMRALAGRIARLGQPATRSASAPAQAGLSERQAGILRLIAGGKTDREIAQALHLSPKTVGYHVGAILGKINAANRTEAAAYAARHGLA